MGRLTHMARLARPWVRRAGFDVVRWPGARHGYLRARILERLGVEAVLDVGANVGQYGRELRAFGYNGEIRSFEPMRAAYSELVSAIDDDYSWTAVNCAVGPQQGHMSINIAGNSISSSLLPMLDRHVGAAPGSSYVATETVQVERLDALIDSDYLRRRQPFLKVDTQGYEAAVLDSATDLMGSLVGIELEMSLVPLYEGQMLMPETIDRMQDDGFRLTEISPGFTDRASGDTLQVDAIFVRS